MDVDFGFVVGRPLEGDGEDRDRREHGDRALVSAQLAHLGSVPAVTASEPRAADSVHAALGIARARHVASRPMRL